MSRSQRRSPRSIALLPLLVGLALGLGPGALLPSAHADEPVVVTRRTEPKGWYNTDYIFAATRQLKDADMPEAIKVPLVPVTLVVDTASLPFALILGLFGR